MADTGPVQIKLCTSRVQVLLEVRIEDPSSQQITESSPSWGRVGVDWCD